MKIEKSGEALTEDELILSLCREAGKDGSEKGVIDKFREKYPDQSELIKKASQGDSKALRRLRRLCGLKVITKFGIWKASKRVGWSFLW